MRVPARLPKAEELKAIWKAYVEHSILDERIPAYIAEGWKKCRAAGLDPYTAGTGIFTGEELFRSILAENRILINAALPIMQSVSDTMESSHSVLSLTDSTGCILQVVGSASDLDDVQHKVNYYPGVRWDNLSVGTNGISAALDHDMTVQLRGAEHWAVCQHAAVCSSVPIHDPDGVLIGCLNLADDTVSLDDNAANMHSLGLVQAAVEGIEGKLRMHRNMEMLQASLANAADCIFMIGSDGRPVWLNRAAAQLLGSDPETAADQDFREILPDIPWAEIRNIRTRFFASDILAIVKDRQIRCSVEMYPLMDFDRDILNIILREQKHLISTANKLFGNRASHTFDSFFTTDPVMKRTLALAGRYADYEGDILIEGEAGTEKEMLAQAIHNESRRRERPFVTVNCSSLPIDRMKKELFGCEAAAGVEGNPGKFEIAEGGTILLNHIGALTMEIQRELGHVLATHRITREGGTETPLDIRIICTIDSAADGLPPAFDNDLMTRLPTLRLNIPPLRERKPDIALFTERFLDLLNDQEPENKKSVTAGFLAELQKYDWPGNLRELRDEIERVFCLSGGNILDKDLLKPMTEIVPARAALSEEEQKEAEYLRELLKESRGNVEQAAAQLGISRATLYRRLKKLGIRASKLKHFI